MTTRRRASHFALMDTAFPADRKFVKLARKATIPIEYAAAIGVFWLLLADARRSKAPDIDWADYEEYGPQIELLKEVGLLVDTGFPPEPFDKWAPVYKSPWDGRRAKGDASVRNGTHRNDASVQLDSIPGGGGPGAEPTPLKAHLGQHPNCTVCAPLQVAT